jgi:hypothetical protein
MSLSETSGTQEGTYMNALVRQAAIGAPFGELAPYGAYAP